MKHTIRCKCCGVTATADSEIRWNCVPVPNCPSEVFVDAGSPPIVRYGGKIEMIEVQQPDGTWQDLIDLRGESEEVEGSPAEDMLRALKTWKVSTEPLTMPTTYMEIVRERDLLYRRLACAVSALEFYAISGGNATVAQIALTDIKNLE